MSPRGHLDLKPLPTIYLICNYLRSYPYPLMQSQSHLTWGFIFAGFECLPLLFSQVTLVFHLFTMLLKIANLNSLIA